MYGYADGVGYCGAVCFAFRSHEGFSFMLNIGGVKLKPSMTSTFLDLGDATSRNLEYSHSSNRQISYGEETITETNLLEIRRRHSDRILVHSFTKQAEARKGADWEWHIVGKRLTARMRVQAKRLQCNDVLSVQHKVKSSGKQQRDLLIDGAKAEGMKPVYCIYCTEAQRQVWKQGVVTAPFEALQAGCLLADAEEVPLTTKRLQQIEGNCIPWHFLFRRSVFVRRRQIIIGAGDAEYYSQVGEFTLTELSAEDDERATKGGDTGWNAPTIDDLNREPERKFDRAGIRETTDEDRARVEPHTDAGEQIAQDDRGRLLDRGIHRMLVIDARDELGPDG